ncbi:MAG: MerR family transcriptional regulator [Clostridia bacterium]|nr:MerR family transcriptional regulator [Clostridia bacterium]
MRIQEIERLTGLTRKTIRYWESRGLLSVGRSDNQYRDYDDEALRRIMEIAMLRQAGISVTGIGLWQDGVISADEMLETRLAELRDADALTASQREMIDRLRGVLAGGNAEPSGVVQDGEDADFSASESMVIGIDIGTTTISAAIIDLETGRQLTAYTLASGAAIPTDSPHAHLQDAAQIARRVQGLLDSLIARYGSIRAIGLSGQMHGIVYTDANGALCSPLWTWQDESAGLPIDGGASAAARLQALTGGAASAGYGLATHYYHLLTGTVPAGAAKLCSVADSIAMLLTGRREPLVHTSMAASFGCFDHGFLPTLKAAGIDAILPEVTADAAIAGEYRGIPVAVAIGDNQASFLGSVKSPRDTVLVNFGTGSQISMMTKDGAASGDIELRPFIGSTHLMSGSALCGGRAWAILEKFFAAYAGEIGVGGSQYAVMERLAFAGMDAGINARLHVRTTFCGKRSEPSLRGCIDGIGEENFTPGILAAGVLYGMAGELREMYDAMAHAHVRTLAASGNAVRLNAALREVLRRVFGMEVMLPAHAEEAAHGAAMFAALAAGLVGGFNELEKYVSYKEET